MNLRDTIMLYGVTLGRRFTKRQRYRFLQQMEELAKSTGLPIRVQTPAKGGKLRPTENIILGDPNRAKVLFAVPFDTPARALFPCRYYPFHPELTIKEEHQDLLAHGLVALILILASYFPISIALARQGGWYALFAAAAVMVYVAIRQIRGTANPVNFNRASAAVAVAAKLAEDLAGKKNAAAFVFCDRAATSYEGYKLLAQEVGPNARVIVLDCIAKGEELILAHGPQANLRAQRLMELLPQGTRERSYAEEETGRNLLALFPAGMVLTGGSIENGELVVHHTRSPKDIGLDLPRLEGIEKALAEFAAKA